MTRPPRAHRAPFQHSSRPQAQPCSATAMCQAGRLEPAQDPCAAWDTRTPGDCSADSPSLFHRNSSASLFTTLPPGCSCSSKPNQTHCSTCPLVAFPSTPALPHPALPSPLACTSIQSSVPRAKLEHWGGLFTSPDSGFYPTVQNPVPSAVGTACCPLPAMREASVRSGRRARKCRCCSCWAILGQGLDGCRKHQLLFRSLPDSSEHLAPEGLSMFAQQIHCKKAPLFPLPPGSQGNDLLICKPARQLVTWAL